MAQPTAYTRQYAFDNFQSSNPTTPLPANQIEAEYDAIKLTLGQTLANLALIQRDDTKLANSSVHVDALDTATKALVVSGAFTIKGAWVTATAYVVGDLVVDSGVPYVCYVAHTSGASIDTSKFSALTAALQTANDPLDDNKFLRAQAGVGVWTTLTASMLTDVPAVQSFLTAATVAAARTALGSTTVGDAVFVAASAAAARSALGVTATGDSLATAASAAAARSAIDVPQLGGANTFTADQTIQSTDAGATEAPALILDRNSASPADNDLLGHVDFNMRSDLPSTRTAAKILAQALDVSDTTEDAILALQTIVAGALATRAYVGQGMVVGAPTGGDKGAGSLNVESLYVGGSALGGISGPTTFVYTPISTETFQDFTIPAGTKEIVLLFGAFSLSGTDDIRVRLGTAGGIDSGTVGGAAFDYFSAAVIHIPSSNHSAAYTDTTGWKIPFGSATAGIHGIVRLNLLDGSSVNGWTCEINTSYTSNSTCNGAGSKELDAAVTTLRVMSTGTNTFDNGRLAVLTKG